MTKPKWYEWARKEIGQKEVPGKASNKRILEYRKLAKTPLEGEDGVVPWCMIFTNAAFASTGLPTTGSGLARSPETSKHFIRLREPAEGCVVTFWRQSPRSGLGHIGFYVKQTKNKICVVGGNQKDSVSEAWFPIVGTTMGFSGFWWPKSVPLPKTGKVLVEKTTDSGSVVSVV
jgi:uncharacterized protein (TIGR02594 family)